MISFASQELPQILGIPFSSLKEVKSFKKSHTEILRNLNKVFVNFHFMRIKIHKLLKKIAKSLTSLGNREKKEHIIT